ncbi:MAG: DUF1295 domain-containing protein [Pseudomonadales bacterium]|nr:DUF1295 domain-containing protein [Pseudomonadales bacterium]
MIRALVVLLVSALLAAGLALAGSDQSSRIGNLPVFAICIAIAFIMQWIAFIPAWINKTEKFYDLTGSATYITVMALACVYTAELSLLKMIIAACVVLWALRLGSFLFLRIVQDKNDRRFDKIKTNPARFFSTWNLQGLWVSFTAAAALAAISSGRTEQGFAAIAIIGAALWLLGFIIEAVADAQKRRFRKQRASEQGSTRPFIDTGLWALSRHPNYFGEILLWAGVALMAVPLLQGWQFVTLVSPLFVYLLLTRISGVPLLERSADERYGNDPAYIAYKQRTPVLFPRLRSAK